MTIIATKLYAPPPRPDRVARAGLLERLDEGLRPGRRLILVSAPAGSGKTTLLSDWAHQGRADGSPDRPAFAWLSLDEGDDDPTRFVTHAIAALQTIDPRLGETASAIAQAPVPTMIGPSIEGVLASLINDLAGRARPLVLILDDYHVVSAPVIHEAVAFFLDHLPPDVHLALATRTDPPLPLSRLRARDQMTELRAEQLRFTPAEAAAFLAEAMSLDLTEDNIAALENRTEGWVAGLQLAALSLRGRQDAAAFVAAFTGSNRFVLDYLVEEVLGRQPEEVQRFLLQTSILERMTGDLCDAVTGRDDGHVMLEALEQANLFVTPLDQHRAWYRYHRLFVEFLRVRQGQMSGPSTAELHVRASAWYETHHLLPEAIAHALSADDTERTARLVEAAAYDTLMPGQAGALLGWLAALPEATIRTRVRLCLARAWALLTSGHLDDVETWLAWATQAPGGNDATIIAEADALRSFLGVLLGDADGAVALAHRSLAHLPEGALFLRSWVTLNLGMAHERLGQNDDAARTYSLACATGQAAGDDAATFTAMCQSADLEVLQGHLHQAADRYAQAIAVGSQQGRRLPMLALAHARLGGLYYEWDDLETAAEHYRTAMDLGRRWEAADIDVAAPLGLARVCLARGDVDEARRLAAEAEDAMGGPVVSPLTIDVAGVDMVRFWLMAGDLGEAVRWSPGGHGDARSAGDVAETIGAARARLLLAQGRPEKALVELEPLLQSAERLEHVGHIVELLALQALAQHALGRGTPATTALARALALGEREGLVRTFIDEGAPMAALLRASHHASPTYADRLLAAMGGIPAAPHRGILTSGSGLIEPLSARELEVLALIGRGLSNNEIADRLVIALSTVKTHINNIYGKLGVQSRVQAVTRAQDLGLL